MDHQSIHDDDADHADDDNDNDNTDDKADGTGKDDHDVDHANEYDDNGNTHDIANATDSDDNDPGDDDDTSHADHSNTLSCSNDVDNILIHIHMIMRTIWTCGECTCFTCGAKGIHGKVGGGERYCNERCQYPPCVGCGKERVKNRAYTEKQKPRWKCLQCTKEEKQKAASSLNSFLM